MNPTMVRLIDARPFLIGCAILCASLVIVALCDRALQFVTERVRGYPSQDCGCQAEDEDPADFWKHPGGEP